MASFNTCLTIVFAFAAAVHTSEALAWPQATVQEQAQQLTLNAPDPATDTLHSLDTNGDGWVDFSEVATFAKEKGLDYRNTLQEFSAFDADHNGMLDSGEVSAALGTSPSAQQPQLEEQQPRPAAPVIGGSGAFAAATRQGSQPVLPQSAEVRSSAGEAAQQSSPAGAAGRAASGYSVEAQQAMLAKVSAALSREVTAEQEAAASEGAAAEKRSRLAALRGSVEEKAQESGQTAAKAKAEEIVHTLQQMDRNATRMEIAAAAINAKGKAEVQFAESLSSVANEALAR